MAGKSETLRFQAETNQLLDLVVHSLYTDKDIFLRELISNASDALDRLRFEALSNPELLGGDEQKIRIDVDRDARTLSVSDNGIGMSREEVVSNIGTIARSGTRELRDRLREAGSAESVEELIGQFGVGFYSAFMVADRVTLVTRRAGEEGATRWESTGDGQYTVEDAERDGHGTTITLHLKPADDENGHADYTDPRAVRRIVQRYSDYISYPIVMREERSEVERDEAGKPVEGAEPKKVLEDKVLNSMKPIWMRQQSEVGETEYAEFYKHIAHDWNDPLRTIPMKAEGRLEYRALLFIPAKAPFDLFYELDKVGLRLYAKGVLIMERAEELLPRYLRFVKGVVDSADLPLNVSRQMLQQDWQAAQIRKGVTKKVLDTLQSLRDTDEEKYLAFWKEFGAVLKEGAASEADNREKILGLLLFQSSNDPEKLTTLAQYVERARPDQDAIYYLTGESRSVVENSPHLEAFREKGYEVLFLTDPIDEFVVQSVHEFEGKRLQSAAKGALALGGEEERKRAEEELKAKGEEFGDFLKTLQTSLDKYVREVRLSNRLTSSPACLVAGEFDLSPQMERMLGKVEGRTSKQRRSLELNPEHEVVRKMRERFEKDASDPLVGKFALLLYGNALLAEGSPLPDPAEYNRLVAELMAASL